MLRDSETAFLISIEPPLLAGKRAVALARLRASWPPDRLENLLGSPCAKVVSLAATCLGLTGTADHCSRLAALLSHDDDEVVASAEGALWALWMQEGSDDARARLVVAAECLRIEDFDTALRVLDALAGRPDAPAEAHHQRALALHALERHDEAEQAYRRTVALNPRHFAAFAGLGHLCSEQRRFADALEYYRRALGIHPRLMELREIVPRLEAAIRRRIVA